MKGRGRLRKETYESVDGGVDDDGRRRVLRQMRDRVTCDVEGVENIDLEGVLPLLRVERGDVVVLKLLGRAAVQ